MSTRTFNELHEAVNHAMGIDDSDTLLRCAAELEALGTREANVIAATARGTADRIHCNYASALEHYNRVLAMNEEMGNRGGVASVNSNIGNVHSLTGNYPEAMEHYCRALALYEELDNRVGSANTTCNIGNVHKSTGNYPAALEHYRRALAVYEELGILNTVANVTGNLGALQHSLGNFPEALEHYNRSLAVHEELGNRSGAALITGNIGAVHYSTGDHATSLEYYNRALDEHEDLGERNNVSRITANILNAMIECGMHGEAAELLLKMDAMQIEDPYVKVMREQLRAELQWHDGLVEDARSTLHSVLEIARRYSLSFEHAEIHKQLRDHCQKENDFPGYIEHNNEYTRLTEEINGKEATLKIAMQEKQREIDAREKEHAKHMAVLHSTLPKHIADRVARGETVNDSFDNASVLFLDVVGFTTHSSELEAGEIVSLLQNIFTTFDAICVQHDVMKIKTIGDSYMAVAFGTANSEQRIANVAIDMMSSIFTWPHTDERVMFRIGLHSGPVVAGVLGTERMQYDVWGDTVNVASRMESTSEPGRIHVSEALNDALKEALNEARTAPRGTIEIKGKGLMQTFWLED